jgi:hypothetical protein
VLHGAGRLFREMEKSLPSICQTGSKFRVKANFLLADQLGLRTMMLQELPVFPAKTDCPVGPVSNGEHNAVIENGEEKRRQ